MLNGIVEDAAQFSGYDIIVDDGGHKSSQMLTSFRVSRLSVCATQDASLTECLENSTSSLGWCC